MTEIMPFPENNILFYWAAPQGCIFFADRPAGQLYSHATPLS